VAPLASPIKSIPRGWVGDAALRAALLVTLAQSDDDAAARRVEISPDRRRSSLGD
jgi:hypothetical protein